MTKTELLQVLKTERRERHEEWCQLNEQIVNLHAQLDSAQGLAAKLSRQYDELERAHHALRERHHETRDILREVLAKLKA